MKLKILRDEKLLLWIIFSLVIMMVGASMNKTVTNANNGKMPFLSDYQYNDREYFSFILNSKPKLWILSDIIIHWNGVCSIGDLMMWQGILTVPLLISFYLYYKMREIK